MNFRTTYILFGVLGGLVVLFFLVILLNPAKPPDQTYVLPSLHDAANPVQADQIDRVEIDHVDPKGERIVFVRDPDSGLWTMTEPLQLARQRVDHTAVNNLVSEVMNARKDEDRSVDVKPPLSKWGLEPPAVTVTLKKGEDRSWTINLGKKSESKGGQTSVVYVSSSDLKQTPVAVRLNQLQGGFKTVGDFRDKDLLADNATEIKSVTLRDGKHDPVALRRTDETHWHFSQPAYGEAEYQGETPPFGAAPTTPASPSVRSLLEVLAALKVEYTAGKVDDYVSNDDKDLERYGLAPDQRTGHLRIEVDRTLSAATGASDKKPTVTEVLWLGNKVDDKSNKYYAKLEDQPGVVKVAFNPDPVTRVLDDPSLLRNRDLVQIEEFRLRSIDAVAIKNKFGTLELFRPAGAMQWQLYRGSDTKGEKADEETTQGLIHALTAKRQVRDFPDPKTDLKTLGLDDPQAVVSLWVEGIQKEEKKDTAKEGEKKEAPAETKPKLKSDKPNVKLSFGKRDAAKGVVYVRRETNDDTTPTLLAVPDALLDRVTEGPLAYLDRSLPSFTGEPNKLTLEYGGQVYEMNHDKDSGAWNFAQPKEWAGRHANPTVVGEILRELRELRAETLVSEKATPEQEQQLGLQKPRVKATVSIPGKDNKPEDWTYLFGEEVPKDKPGAGGLYARESRSDLVFTVRKEVLTILQEELRDRTVFRFDPSKVKTLKLTGWYGPRRMADVLDFERQQGGSWVVKPDSTLPKLEPNGQKIEELVKALNGLRIEQFLDPKTGPKPEKMTIEEDALDIEITVEGEKEPLKLTLGGEAPDKKNYFATSNKVPGETFLVWKQPFEAARKEPVYFGK